MDRAFLDHWSAVKFTSSVVLVGRVTGHALIPTREQLVRTSPVVALDLDRRIAVTASSGRLYHLSENFVEGNDELIEMEVHNGTHLFGYHLRMQTLRELFKDKKPAIEEGAANA